MHLTECIFLISQSASLSSHRGLDKSFLFQIPPPVCMLPFTGAAAAADMENATEGDAFDAVSPTH